MKKLLCAVLAALLLFGLTACGGGKSESESTLPDGFDEESVTAEAKEVVSHANDGDYETICGMLRDDLKDQLTPEALEEAWGDTLGGLGAFQEYKTVATASTQDKTTKEDYAVVGLVCTYEKGEGTFTLSFDKDLALVGLYLK